METNLITTLQNIKETGQNEVITLANGDNVTVDIVTADSLLSVLEILDDENKESMILLLENSMEDFFKVVDFALTILQDIDSKV